MAENIVNENSENVEQITKHPIIPLKKVKDPKKVAAGKKLVEYNKKAKQKQKQVQESQPKDPEENGSETDSWLPETSLSNLIALFGLGFSASNLFLRYKSQTVTENKKTEPEFNLRSVSDNTAVDSIWNGNNILLKIRYSQISPRPVLANCLWKKLQLPVLF